VFQAEPFDLNDVEDFEKRRLQAVNHRWALLGRTGAFAMDPVVRCLQIRACALVGVPVSQLSPVKLHCYRQGEFFLPHLDYVPNGDPRRHRFVRSVLSNCLQICGFSSLNDVFSRCRVSWSRMSLFT
jgi:hypothetical protein